MKRGTILIVDSDRESCRSLERVARGVFDDVTTIITPNRISEILRKKQVDVVLLDTNFTSAVKNGNEGLFWLREILSTDDNISVVIVTATDDIDLAVTAIREGAVDYIMKPCDDARLLATLNIALQLNQTRNEAVLLKRDNRHLKDVINSAGERIIRGASPTMIRVMDIVRKVASTDANVLVTGENGTGKELIAREIHRLSRRADELMVSVDMGSLTETLFESELFGHVRGAFTDAREDRIGKIEAANGSTLFLDEIGNLSMRSQAKLLSVLQNRYIVRVGSNRHIPVDVRLVCATNCDIVKMVSEGKFREDLLYRINTIIIDVPPLRDRVDDIPVLANHFLKEQSERYDRKGMKISIPALEKLTNYSWPGNVRELQHAMEKAVIMSDSLILKPSDFTFSTASAAKSPQGDVTLAEMEKRVISDSLIKYSYNISTVAEKLGITRQTLYNKISKYDL
jgi:DNA-binding NtrC family response regulator